MQGPEAVWDAYQASSAYAFAGTWGRAAPFTIQLAEVLSSRRVSDEEHKLKLSKAILDVVNGTADVCHRCYGAQGVHLWGRSSECPPFAARTCSSPNLPAQIGICCAAFYPSATWHSCWTAIFQGMSTRLAS